MKWCFYYILFSFALTPLINDAIGSGMWEGTASVQSFQEADSQNSSQTVLFQPQPSKKAFPEKDVLSSKASKVASQDAAPNNLVFKGVVSSAAAPTSLLSNSDDVSASANASLERVSASAVQAELAQLNENSLQFQQQTDEQLVILSSNVQLLQQRLQNLEKAMMLLNQELIQLKQAPRSELLTSQSQRPKLSITAWVSFLKKKLGPIRFQMLIGGMVIVLLLLIWVCSSNRKKAAK